MDSDKVDVITSSGDSQPTRAAWQKRAWRVTLGWLVRTHRAGWFGLAARLGLAGVFLYAGSTKIGDLARSVRATNAYEILPYGAAKVVGTALPFMEIALALLLIAGLATRFVAGISALFMTAFIAGIASVWARGIRIDCGCFGDGGALTADQSTNYLWEIVRDAALLAIAGYLLFRPYSRYAVDNTFKYEEQE